MAVRGSLTSKMAEYRQKMKLLPLFPVSYKVLKNQPTNCSPRTRCTAIRTAALLHIYVCSKGLDGGWVDGALRRRCGG